MPISLFCGCMCGSIVLLPLLWSSVACKSHRAQYALAAESSPSSPRNGPGQDNHYSQHSAKDPSGTFVNVSESLPAAVPASLEGKKKALHQVIKEHLYLVAQMPPHVELSVQEVQEQKDTGRLSLEYDFFVEGVRVVGNFSLTAHLLSQGIWHLTGYVPQGSYHGRDFHRYWFEAFHQGQDHSPWLLKQVRTMKGLSEKDVSAGKDLSESAAQESEGQQATQPFKIVSKDPCVVVYGGSFYKMHCVTLEFLGERLQAVVMFPALSAQHAALERQPQVHSIRSLRLVLR